MKIQGIIKSDTLFIGTTNVDAGRITELDITICDVQ